MTYSLDEIDRLAKGDPCKVRDYLYEHWEEIKRDLERYKTDAERYRHLLASSQSQMRKGNNLHLGLVFYTIVPWEPDHFSKAEERLSAAIDAQLARGKEEKS